VGLTPEDALCVLPATLRDELLSAFNEIVKNYREHRWEPSELNGGKLCETGLHDLQGLARRWELPGTGRETQAVPGDLLGDDEHVPACPGQ
jgi:hypothetical protein